MTTPNPTIVYEITEAFIDGISEPIPNVTGLTASADIDREPYVLATLTIGSVTDELWALLDPRDGVEIRWQSRQYDINGVEIGRLPVEDDPDSAIMWLRTARRDHITGEVTLELAGGESMLDDKKRIAGTTLDTAATTLQGLVEYSLIDVFGAALTTADGIAYSTAIPAGDRRLMVQGESHADLMQPELDAVNCRVFDSWGRVWATYVRSTAHPTPLKLATYEVGAPSDADPSVTAITETLSRDGDWADGVLVEYSAPGSTTTTWQASGTGANTRGVVLHRDRAAPGANAANQIVNRTKLRGYDIEVVARLRYEGVAFAQVYGCRPQNLTVYTPDRTVTGRIRSVEWDTEAGTMTIRAQTGDPIS